MKYAGSSLPISQGVFLLSEAVIAYQRGDNISCVVLASAALENSIVERVKKHCKENYLHFTWLGTLGKKFKKLNEYGISIPIPDYKKRIVDFRNNVVHQALCVSDNDARRFWKDCHLLMREFNNSMVMSEE